MIKRIALGAVFCALAWQAQADKLPDPNFGQQGLVQLAAPQAVKVLGTVPVSDGKYVVVSNEKPGADDRVVMRRFNANGTLDSSFYTTGTRQLVIKDVPGRSERAGAVFRFPGGKTMIAGVISQTVEPEFPSLDDGYWLFLYMLGADGKPDLSFGTDGVETYSDSSVHRCRDVVDGRHFEDTGAGDFVLLCRSNVDDRSITLLKFNDDGSLYTQFGSNGAVLQTLSGWRNVEPVALAVANKSVYVGVNLLAFQDSAKLQGGMFRITTLGVIDKTGFGTEGLVQFSEPNTSVELQGIAANNALPMALLTYRNYPQAGQQRLVLWKLTERGRSDTAFGTEGKLFFGDSGHVPERGRVIAQPNRRVVVVNEFACEETQGCKLALRRLKENGGNDALFAANGFITVTPSGSGYISRLSALNVNTDSSLQTSFFTTPTAGSDKQITVLRIQGDDISPKPFSFKAQKGAERFADVTSEEVTISEVDTAIVLSSEDLIFSVNGGDWRYRTAVAEPGDKVRVQQRAAESYNTSKTSEMMAGSLKVTFTSTTRDPPPPEQGGGAAGGLVLLLLGLLGWRRPQD